MTDGRILNKLSLSMCRVSVVRMKTSRHIVLGREKKTRVIKHMVMQAIGHHRAPCYWPKKNNGEIISLAHMRLHVKITGHRTKLKQELSIN